MSSSAAYTHLRIPYYRPRFMGGDTQSPLCHAPITGCCGDRPATFSMTDAADKVTCPRCLRDIASGGLSARLVRLEQSLSRERCGHKMRRQRVKCA